LDAIKFVNRLFDLSSINKGFSLKGIYSTLALALCFCSINAQQPEAGLQREILSSSERKLSSLKANTHHQIMPAARGMDAAYESLMDSTSFTGIKKNKLEIKPFALLAGGLQTNNNNPVLADAFGGAMVDFNHNKKLFATIGFSYNVLLAPQYLENFANTTKVLPGVDYAGNFKDNVIMTPYSFGRVSYQAGKYFNFEVGKGKNFMGDGYRSLILSDVSATYPYGRIVTKVGKIQYTNLWAQMRDLSLDNDIGAVRRKYIAMHSISFNINSRVNFSLYEMVVWQNKDTTSERALDINYLNPIIFYRPVEYALGSADNVLLAASLRVKATKKIQVYGQLLVDEFNLKQLRSNSKWWADKFGGQLGFKTFDVFIKGLCLQSELNAVRPFTYSHGSPVQSWTNLNQPLAHPLGANFLEWVNIVRYDFGKWKFTEQFNWAGFGRDRDIDDDGVSDNLGGDIFRSYKKPFRIYANTLMQGNKSTFMFHQFTISRKILPNDQLEAFVSHTFRYEKNDFGLSQDQFIMLGIRTTGLLQPQRDF